MTYPTPKRTTPVDLHLSGIDVPEWTLRSKNSSGRRVPATGLTVLVFYSLTKDLDAEAIDDSLSKVCTEYEDKPGTYSCQMLEDDKLAHLSGLEDEVIYEIVVVEGIARDYQARRVVAA